MQRYILFIISLAIAYLILEWWTRSYYHVSIREVSGSLGKAEISFTKKLLALLASLLVFYIAAILISSIIHPLPLHLWGESQQMVFAGYSQPGIATYYLSPGQNASLSTTVVKGLDTYSTTFKGLFAEQKFSGLGLDEGYYGLPAAPYSIFQTLMNLALLCFFLTVLIGVYHILAWSSSLHLQAHAELPGAPGQAFDYVLSKSITKGGFAFGLLGSVLIWIGAYVLMPKPSFGEPTIDITRYRQPGDIVQGVPMHRMVVKEKVYETTGLGPKDRFDRREKWVDTGKRVISIEFPHVFPVPVYVSYTFNILEQPELDDYFEFAIKQKDLNTFSLSENLELMFTLPK